jgi:hypothetical protein
MPTISPSQMRAFARNLMNDQLDGRENRASRNDGQILARMVQSGDASRAALDAAIDEIEKSGLGLDKKKEALRVLETYKDKTATGFEAELFSVDKALTDKLAYHGVDDLTKLLGAGATTAKREHLAQQIHSDEKTIRRLVKQADLMRVGGIDAKLAHVLVTLGVDSVPELKNRNVDNLLEKIEKFAKSQEGYVVSLKAPSRADVDAWVQAASALPKAVDFASAQDSFDSLTMSERLDLYLTVGQPLKTRSYDQGLVKLFTDLGVAEPMDAINQMRKDAAWEVANELEYHGVDVSAATVEAAADYDALIEWVNDNIGSSEADAMGNGWAEWKNPEIELIKNGNKTVGATIQFTRIIDGDHDYWTRYVFDATEGRIIASETGGYETDDDLSLVGPGSTLSASNTAKLLKDLTANDVNNVSVNGQNLWVGADHVEGDQIAAAEFKSVRHIRHDNIAIRAFASSGDPLEAELVAGLSQADKKKVEDTIAEFRSKMTNLSVVDVDGGYWGDGNDSVYLAGLDPSGNMMFLRAERPSDDS